VDREGDDRAGVPRLSEVVRAWRGNGLRESTIRLYAAWVRRFTVAWKSGADLRGAVTRREALRLVRRYARMRGLDPEATWREARSALRAWAWGRSACGVELPPWQPPSPPRAEGTPLVAAYVRHRRAHRGVAESSLVREIDALRDFLGFVRSRGRRVTRVRLSDVDAYVVARRQRWARRTVARACVTIRAFLRFLHATGRHPFDLAASVAAPLSRRGERPPRAMPWTAVRRILAGIDRSTRAGRRDYALLLTMASYGLGGGEVRALRLEDVDWTGGSLRIRRPKTGVAIMLPLLPAVARALVAYLRRGRPRHALSRALFVRLHAPHGALQTSSAIGHVLRKYARLVGVGDVFLGSHALRHSHATQQVDLGVPQPLVAGILGHRRPESTSAYVRVALRRLRPLALPVPR
jgi:integrase